MPLFRKRPQENTVSDADLAQRVLGKHHAALLAVRSDPALTAAVEAYAAAGGPVIDLDGVFVHARPARVESVLEEWQRARTGGPCTCCGSAVGRLGVNGSEGFSEGRCGSCRDLIADHGLQGLLLRVFVLTVGIRGTEPVDRVLTAEEAGFPSTEAWGHVALVAEALRAEVAAPGSGYDHFATMPFHNQPTPGLPEPYRWPAAPSRPTTSLAPSPEAAERAQADAAALARARQLAESAAEARRRNLESADRLGIPVGALPAVGGHRA